MYPSLEAEDTSYYPREISLSHCSEHHATHQPNQLFVYEIALAIKMLMMH